METLERAKIGFRKWKVREYDYTLEAVAYAYDWQCGINYAEDHSNRYNDTHESPHPNCQCGFNAWSDINNVDEYGGITGAIAMAGKIEVHSKGWRSSEAQIIALCMDKDINSYYNDPEELLKGLGARYGVPVFETRKELLAFCDRIEKKQDKNESDPDLRRAIQRKKRVELFKKIISAPLRVVKKHVNWFKNTDSEIRVVACLGYLVLLGCLGFAGYFLNEYKQNTVADSRKTELIAASVLQADYYENRFKYANDPKELGVSDEIGINVAPDGQKFVMTIDIPGGLAVVKGDAQTFSASCTGKRCEEGKFDLLGYTEGVNERLSGKTEGTLIRIGTEDQVAESSCGAIREPYFALNAFSSHGLNRDFC